MVGRSDCKDCRRQSTEYDVLCGVMTDCAQTITTGYREERVDPPVAPNRTLRPSL